MCVSQMCTLAQCIPVRDSEKACEREKNKIVIGNIETGVHRGNYEVFILLLGILWIPGAFQQLPVPPCTPGVFLVAPGDSIGGGGT